MEKCEYLWCKLKNFINGGVYLVKGIVETPWNGLYKLVLFGFGVPFFLIGLVFLFINGSWGFILNGALWMLVGIGLKIKSIRLKVRLNRLKNEGISYEGAVINIIPSHWVRIGSFVTARVECSYSSENGECFIKSGYHLLSPMDRIEKLYSKIYFDATDPSNYVVELFRRDHHC